MNPQQFRPRIRLAAVGLIATLATWLLILLDATTVVFFTALCGILIWTLVKKWWVMAAIVLIGNPISFMFMWPMLDYARGTATFSGYGLPRTESWNLDAEYRVPRFSGGCLVDPRREVLTEVHNAGIRFASIFGPMPGAYLGPYPDRDVALAAVQDAPFLDKEEVTSDQIVLHDRTITLNPGVGRRMLRDFGSHLDWYVNQSSAAETQLRGAVVDWPCVAVQIPGDRSLVSSQDSDGRGSVIVLFDGVNGRPFACYAFEPVSTGPPWFFIESLR